MYFMRSPVQKIFPVKTGLLSIISVWHENVKKIGAGAFAFFVDKFLKI